MTITRETEESFNEYCLPKDFDIERGDVLVFPGDCRSEPRCEYHLYMRPSVVASRRAEHEYRQRGERTNQLTLKTPDNDCCTDNSCHFCKFWGQIKAEIKDRELSRRLERFDHPTRVEIVARPLGRFLSRLASSKGSDVLRKTWVLSGCESGYDWACCNGSMAEIARII